MSAQIGFHGGEYFDVDLPYGEACAMLVFDLLLVTISPTSGYRSVAPRYRGHSWFCRGVCHLSELVKVCFAAQHGVFRTNGVVSPRGIQHRGCDGGWTVCGKDATGDAWWWPL